MQRNELDLGIFPSGGTLPKLETQPLSPGEPLVAFLTADHPLAKQPVIGPDAVTGETLVSFWQAGHPPLAAWLREQMEGAGYRFRALHESGTDTRDWVVAVAEGRGLALLPARPAQRRRWAGSSSPGRSNRHSRCRTPSLPGARGHLPSCAR